MFKFIFLFLLLFSVSIFGEQQKVNLLVEPFNFNKIDTASNVDIFSKPGQLTFKQNYTLKIVPDTGILITSSYFVDENLIRVNFTTRNAPEGKKSIVITIDGKEYVCEDALNVGSNPFKVTPFEITNITNSLNLTVVAGEETNFGTSGTVIIEPSNGITVTNTTFNNKSINLQATLNNAPLGYKTMKIVSGGKTYSLTKAFSLGKAIQGGIVYDGEITNNKNYTNLILLSPTQQDSLTNADKISAFPATGITLSNVTFPDLHSIKFNMNLSNVPNGSKTLEIKSDVRSLFIPGFISFGGDLSLTLDNIEPNIFEQGSDKNIILTLNEIPKYYDINSVKLSTNDSNVTFSETLNIPANKTIIDTRIYVANDTTTGKKDVILEWDGTNKVTFKDAITITKPSLTVTPNEVTQEQAGVTLEIKSENEVFTDKTTVEIDDLSTPPATFINSKTLKINNFTISKNAKVGPRNINIYNNGVLYKKIENFMVKQGPNTKILSVSPANSVDQGLRNYEITITGQNTNFSNTSIITNEDNTITGMVTFSTKELIIARVNVSPDANLGAIPVWVKTDYEIAKIEEGLTITEKKNITSVNPDKIEFNQLGQDIILTVTLPQMLETDSYSVWISGENIQIINKEKNIENPNEILVTVNISNESNGDKRDISITEGTTVYYLKEGLDIVVPVITDISPKEVEIGKTSTIHIYGQDTNFDLNTNVKFSPEGIKYLANDLKAKSQTELEILITVAEDVEEDTEFEVTITDQNKDLVSSVKLKAIVKESKSSGGCSFDAKNTDYIPIALLFLMLFKMIFLKKLKTKN